MGIVGLLLLGLVCGAIALDGAADLAGAALALGAAGLAAVAAAQRLRPVGADALAGAAIWSALACLQLAWSDARDAAADGAAAVLGACAVFLVAGAALPRRDRETWLAAFGALGALVALAAVVAAPVGARASVPFGNPNRLAAWLLVPAAPAFIAIGGAGPGGLRGRRSIFWFGVLALCAAGLAGSGSLGAGLACVAAAGAVTWLARAPQRVGLGVVVAGLAAAALALALLPLLAPGWVPWARHGSEFSPGIRWQIYGAALRSGLDAAPLGVGLGGFADAFAERRPGALPYAPRHAHSEPLQAFVELGLPFVLALGASLVLALRRERSEPGARRSFAGWSAVAAGLAVAAHALVDAPLRVPAVAIGLAAVLGIAWVPARPGASAGLRATRLALVSLALALAWLGGTGAVAWRAEQDARAALDRGRFAQAERFARWGLRARPARVGLWRCVADAAEHAARMGDGGPRALARALAARRRAVDAAPRKAGLHVELARTQLAMDDSDAALAQLALASRLDPIAPQPHLARARVLLAQGRPRAAAAAAREALRRHPLATRPVIGELLRLTGEPELALAAIPRDPLALARAGRELDRAGYARAAAAALEDALGLDPANARVALESARAWRRAGRADRAASVLARALAQAPGDARLRDALARGRGGAS